MDTWTLLMVASSSAGLHRPVMASSYAAVPLPSSSCSSQTISNKKWVLAPHDPLPPCCARSTPNYKLLSGYNLLLMQMLTSYPLVLVGLYCGSSSFARVTNELPIGVQWLLCVAGTSFARSTAQLSCPPLSPPTQLSETKPAAYIGNPAVLPL
jgi:hypothetical protein